MHGLYSYELLYIPRTKPNICNKEIHGDSLKLAAVSSYVSPDKKQVVLTPTFSVTKKKPV
jgi:hypothetical protein